MKPIFKKTLKVLLWIVGSILGIFLLLVIALQIPAVQNSVKNKAITFLEGKIKSKVAIDKIEIGLPKKVILEGFYFEDQQKDTLLAGKKLAVDISLFQLLNNKIEINSVSLEGITANIDKDANGVFNFDYIVKAFASPDKPKDDSPPMEIAIDKVNFDDIKFKYSDAVSKNDINVKLKHFETKIKTFDLDKLNFEVPKVKIDGLNLDFKQGLMIAFSEIKKEVESKGKQKQLQIKLDNIDLSNINFGYENENSKLKTAVNLKKLDLALNKIDLTNQIVDIEDLELSETTGNLDFGKLSKIIPQKTNTVANSNSSNWQIKLKNATIKNTNFRLDDANAVAIKRGIDYKHLDIKKFNLKAQDLEYSTKFIAGNIKSLSAVEKSGVDIQDLKTKFYYSDKGAFLKELNLKTPQTLIKDQIMVTYPSIASLNENLGELVIKANLKNSKVGFKDVLLFVPNLEKTNPFKSNPNAVMLVNTTIFGKLKNISIPNLEVSGIGNTTLAASGKIIGLPDAKNAYFDLKIKNLQSSASDIATFVPKGTLPNTIQIPEKFSANGSFKGKINNFNTDLNLITSFGNAKIKALFDQRKKNSEKYDAKTSFDNFDLGKLLKNKSVGKITLNATIAGVGLNPKTANATVNAAVMRADFNKYNYKNIKLKGKIANSAFNIGVNAKDPNLIFDLVSDGSFKNKYPSGKLRLNVDIADLNKLNLHAGPLKLRGEVNADIQTADIDYLNGTLSAQNFTVANDKEQFKLDSVTVVAVATPEKNAIVVKSQILKAQVLGKYKLSQLGKAFSNSIAKYYGNNPKSKKLVVKNQQLAFNVEVKSDPILFKLIPELKSLELIAIAGRYNSDNDSIVINGKIPKIIYGANTITNASMIVDTKDNALVYSFLVDDIENPQFLIPYTFVFGKVEDNTIDYNLQLKDLKDVERYFVSGSLKSNNGNSEIHLDPTKLLLNYEAWNLSEENILRFGKSGIYANNFELSKAGNSIKIQSESERPNAPLAINFENFEIETITNIAQKSALEIGGKINGEALIKNLQKTPLFTSDLTIENFSFKKDTVGNINLKVDNQIANTYNAKVEITGQDNQVNLDGTYKVSSKNLDMNLDIEKLNLKSVQGFTMGNITESTGFLSGNFKIAGNSSKPNVNGELKFNNIGFKVDQLNAKFKLINDKIVFSNDIIALDKFTFKDERDNNLIIDGKINTSNYSNLGFDLAINAKNFNAVNSKAKDNGVYYGELYLDNNLTVKGTLNNPIVEGNVKINKDTKFTVVLPQSDPAIADREGIVEFIDQDSPKLITTIAFDKELSTSEIKGINASVNIEIDKEAELSMVIDKANGDFLKLKGEAILNGGIDPSGKTTLTGRYELTEGSYEMSFNFIKRKFDIKKGSYILWTGEPTTADINITAVYKIETAPIDLLNSQLGSLTEEQKNTYKQKIPFETELKMKGDLLKPNITFDIILPEGNNSVSAEIINTTQAKLARLRQEPEELNKQVFALLLLSRFIGENPFSSESGGTTAGSLARESASKILSQQLNNLAGDLIKGFEVDFDLDSSEDYTTGKKENKTDLNVGLSKRLLNDRLKVTVGSSFGIEGPKQEGQETNNIAGDIAADYKLSKDGKYKLRAYRKNKYQVGLQGQIIESGVGFIITIDYNKFKELYQKSKTP